MAIKLESDLEKQVVRYVEDELGGRAVKLVIAAERGWPDRTILLPDGRIYFAELKRSGGAKRRAQQVVWVRLLKRFGFNAEFIHDIEQFKEWVR